jgi:hypothetical protein
VKFTVDTPAGPRDHHAMVGTGSSFGANSLWLEQGLGDATALRSVEIRWPSGGEPQVLEGLAMNQAWLVREGEPLPTQLPLPALDLPEPN